ncbi:MAG TPA: hypothetical protein VJ904_09190, partial [Tichowtungia sp.]|nr:hypothetical protein [Tichowtungia sp.]
MIAFSLVLPEAAPWAPKGRVEFALHQPTEAAALPEGQVSARADDRGIVIEDPGVSLRLSNKTGLLSFCKVRGQEFIKEPLRWNFWRALTDNDFELKQGDAVTVNLDHLQMGVGGDNSWSRPVNEPCRIQADQTYEWGGLIRPIG